MKTKLSGKASLESLWSNLTLGKVTFSGILKRLYAKVNQKLNKLKIPALKFYTTIYM